MLYQRYFQFFYLFEEKTSYFSAAYRLYLYFISLTLTKRLYSVAIWLKVEKSGDRSRSVQSNLGEGEEFLGPYKPVVDDR